MRWHPDKALDLWGNLQFFEGGGAEKVVAARACGGLNGSLAVGDDVHLCVLRKVKVLHESDGKENAGELTLEGRAGPTCQPIPALDATVVQLGMNAAANISFGG